MIKCLICLCWFLVLNEAFNFLYLNKLGSKYNSVLRSSKERVGPADDDFISRMFSKFLPTPEDLGLTRFNRTSRPENYPCVKDVWADLLPDDKSDADKLLIRQTLTNTNLEFRPLVLAYSSTLHGWKASTFHDLLDKKGPSVVLARSVSGGVFGGYNPTGWVNLGEYRGSIAAFLFTFLNGNEKNRPIKLAKIAGAGMAQIDDGGGPRFGMEGLTIPLSRSSSIANKKVRSKLGLYYERLPNNGNSLLPNGNMEDELVEVKVFVGKYEPDEKIPYSDAMPFSLN